MKRALFRQTIASSPHTFRQSNLAQNTTRFTKAKRFGVNTTQRLRYFGASTTHQRAK